MGEASVDLSPVKARSCVAVSSTEELARKILDIPEGMKVAIVRGRDGEGYFYIVDRKKDLIIVGGFNVCPREVEEILCQYLKIKEATAVGVKDATHGEVVKAFVALKDGQTATEQEIIDFFQGKIAKFKVPRSVEFRKDLPKTLVWKILRRELKEGK